MTENPPHVTLVHTGMD